MYMLASRSRTFIYRIEFNFFPFHPGLGWFSRSPPAGQDVPQAACQPTMGQNQVILRHQKFTFPRVNERTDERVAQYLRLYSCLFQTTVVWKGDIQTQLMGLWCVSQGIKFVSSFHHKFSHMEILRQMSFSKFPISIGNCFWEKKQSWLLLTSINTYKLWYDHFVFQMLILVSLVPTVTLSFSSYVFMLASIDYEKLFC